MRSRAASGWRQQSLQWGVAQHMPLGVLRHALAPIGDQGVRFEPRGEWTRETSEYLERLGCKPGQAPSAVYCRLSPEIERLNRL